MCYTARLHFGCDNIFQHFESLSDSNKIPDIEVLEAAALKLHRTFSCTRAHYRALNDVSGTSEWSRLVPLGTPWAASVVDKSSLIGNPNLPNSKPAPTLSKTKSATTSKKAKKAKEDAERLKSFRGDRVLANSICFMRDALISREMSQAVAEGDVGRVWEVMKVRNWV